MEFFSYCSDSCVNFNGKNAKIKLENENFCYNTVCKYAYVFVCSIMLYSQQQFFSLEVQRLVYSKLNLV